MSETVSAAATTVPKWASGRYAPVQEEVTALDLPVIGELPVELDGRYLRNGPNPMGPVDPVTGHWFVGDGMVHGVRLRDGRAEWYRNRWVRSTKVSETLGEEPAPGERHAGMDTANTNVIGLAGKTFALVEAGARPVELSEELATICHSDLGGTLPHGYTAHPKVDPATGDLHAIAYHWALPHLEYVVIGADGLVRTVQPIEVEGGPMVHDCSITQKWAVVYDLPVAFDLEMAMGGRFPYSWQPERASRVGSGAAGRRRRRSLVRGRALLRVPSDERLRRRRHRGARRRALRPGVRPGPHLAGRLRGPLGPLASRHRHRSRPRRRPAAMSPSSSRGSTSAESAARTDTATAPPAPTASTATSSAVSWCGPISSAGATDVIDLGPGRVSGEWVMVPRADDAAEDDGWLMTLVHDVATDLSELVVLDAGAPERGTGRPRATPGSGARSGSTATGCPAEVSGGGVGGSRPRVRVLVTGATGFVGKRLVSTLVDRGHDVRAMTRHPERYDGPGQPVGADVSQPDSLGPALADVDVAYYLVHSLDDDDFERKDADAARAFGSAAAAAGVGRIVYLGGLGADDPAELSAHLRSRREVEGLLSEARRPDHGAAGRHRDRPRRDLVGDHPAVGQEPPGDGGPALGEDPHAADRPRRRRASARGGGRGRHHRGSGLRYRRTRSDDLRRDAEAGGQDPPRAGSADRRSCRC